MITLTNGTQFTLHQVIIFSCILFNIHHIKICLK